MTTILIRFLFDQCGTILTTGAAISDDDSSSRTNREPMGYQPKVVDDKGDYGYMGIKGFWNRKSKRHQADIETVVSAPHARETHMVEGTESKTIGEEEVEEW